LQTRWMNGLLFYLDEDIPRPPSGQPPGRRGGSKPDPEPVFPRSHILLVDSPWALTCIEQTQFWSPDVIGALPKKCKSIISVDIPDWESPGTTGVPANRMSSRGEIAEEVWRQLEEHLPRLADCQLDGKRRPTAKSGTKHQRKVAFSLD